MGKVSCLSRDNKICHDKYKRQPVHDGIGHDQWAIDSIEIIQ
jgi:hypothetical protein